MNDHMHILFINKNITATTLPTLTCWALNYDNDIITNGDGEGIHSIYLPINIHRTKTDNEDKVWSSVDVLRIISLNMATYWQVEEIYLAMKKVFSSLNKMNNEYGPASDTWVHVLRFARALGCKEVVTVKGILTGTWQELASKNQLVFRPVSELSRVINELLLDYHNLKLKDE